MTRVNWSHGRVHDSMQIRSPNIVANCGNMSVTVLLCSFGRQNIQLAVAGGELKIQFRQHSLTEINALQYTVE